MGAMPAIYCPVCGRITYAYPITDETGAVTAYRCSVCYNVFNYYQVNVANIPRYQLKCTFAEIVKHVNGTEDYEPEQLFHALKHLMRPHYHDDLIDFFYARWDYRGTREADEYNEELEERVHQWAAPYLDKDYYVIELQEPDEGDSIFLAFRKSEAVNRLEEVLGGMGCI